MGVEWRVMDGLGMDRRVMDELGCAPNSHQTRKNRGKAAQREITMDKNSATEIGSPPSNDAASEIQTGIPYTARAIVVGTADLLFHRWSCEAIEEKAAARKNSKAKKTDNLESYVYRTDDGSLAVPGEYFRMAIIHAAKFRQDPRSPRKSAMDLYKAGIISLTTLAPLGTKQWDYEDKRRAVVQRAGITRTRPAMKAGWKVEIDLLVNLPEYIEPSDLHEVMSAAGRLVGVGDFRPTYGRFQVRSFEAMKG